MDFCGSPTKAQQAVKVRVSVSNLRTDRQTDRPQPRAKGLPSYIGYVWTLFGIIWIFNEQVFFNCLINICHIKIMRYKFIKITNSIVVS